MAIIEDISERKKLEQKLLQSQKLESIGQLAAGIAHEINTPTQFVGDNTRFIQEGYKDLIAVESLCEDLLAALAEGRNCDEIASKTRQTINDTDIAYLKEEMPRALEQSLQGIERIANIVGAMKEFAHPGSKDKESIDINHLIENTVTIAASEWKYVANVKFQFSELEERVNCYRQELGQVILNMIVNAVHAIEENMDRQVKGKGVITIATEKIKDYVEIRITDTGKGMPDTIRSRIFDPFFTTKGVGKGSGQGLAIAHSIVVDKHAGSLSCSSIENEGTTFVIRLPLDSAHKQTIGKVA